MTDAAGHRCETDIADLQSRIEPAVFGYLGIGSKAGNADGRDMSEEAARCR